MEEMRESGGRPRGRLWRTVYWSAAAILLLIPWIAMRFTDEVVWTAFDFFVMGALLAGVGLAFELAERLSSNAAYRRAVGIALAAAFLLIWVNGAVGIIGSENNRASLMFFGVLAVATVGAAAARSKPRGMARALFVTALAQVSVAVIALVARFGAGSENWPMDVLSLTAFFTGLWLTSACLFLEAARAESRTGERSGL